MGKQFHQFLDDPEQLPEDLQEKELALLMREVENLETPDPGADYWNQFNRNLWSKLDGLAPKRSRFWFQFPVWLGAAAALILLFVLLKPGAPQPTLESLDSDELLILSQVLEPVEEEAGFDLAEGDVELLLDTYDIFGDDALLEDDFVPINPDEFKDLWKVEG